MHVAANRNGRRPRAHRRRRLRRAIASRIAARAKREFRQHIEARIEADAALIYLMQLQKRKMSKKRFQTPTATSWEGKGIRGRHGEMILEGEEEKQQKKEKMDPRGRGERGGCKAGH